MRPFPYRLCFVLLAAVAAGVYFFFDPAKSPFFPPCLWKQLTGWACAGCGSQRATHALLHGRFAAAWGYNAFFCCALAYLALLATARLLRPHRPTLYTALTHRYTLAALFLATIAWSIGRNV